MYHYEFYIAYKSDNYCAAQNAVFNIDFRIPLTLLPVRVRINENEDIFEPIIKIGWWRLEKEFQN